MIDTEADVREGHTGHILCHSHAIAAFGVSWFVDGQRQVLVDHLDGLNLEHVGEFPGGFGDVRNFVEDKSVTMSSDFLRLVVRRVQRYELFCILSLTSGV